MKRTCLNCDYPLHGLDRHRCPECGQPFDPNDPATFYAPGITPVRGTGRAMLAIVLLLGVNLASPAFAAHHTPRSLLVAYGIPILAFTTAVGLALSGYRTGRGPGRALSAFALLLSLATLTFLALTHLA